jgi:hypothetical protein
MFACPRATIATADPLLILKHILHLLGRHAARIALGIGQAHLGFQERASDGFGVALHVVWTGRRRGQRRSARVRCTTGKCEDAEHDKKTGHR